MISNPLKPVIAMLALMLALAQPVHAGVVSEAAESAAELAVRKFAPEMAESGERALAEEATAQMARYGEREVATAMERCGPEAVSIVREAGAEAAPQALRLMSRDGRDALWIVTNRNRMAIFLRFGDDAAEAMLRHKGIAEGVISNFGNPAARALNAVGEQGSRRLVKLATTGEVAAIRDPAMLDVIARYGDRAMDFIWRNKGALAVTTVAAAFVADPEPFINGTRDIAAIAGSAVLKPVAELPQHVVDHITWTPVLVTAVLGGGLYLWLKRRRLRRL